ncbi:ankyrin repeat domain-containing protein 50-like isoform X2 [Periplaneta americana]|uniref:ankyrin repeat domain-containing protein 50-like isoform X2 n=1 Tax=Periplaneta americana TaxID=6978 RepID=UPI0037E8EA8C
MAKSISLPKLKDLVKTLEEEILPLLEEVKNLNEVQDGISSIDLETGKEDKRAEKNKESEGMGVVNTKEKELLNKQEELIKVYKQLEKLQDEKIKQLTQEHEEEIKSWLQEEECIEEDLANLRDELEEKRRQQEARCKEELQILRKDLETERGMRLQLEASKEEELQLLRAELEEKEEELKKMREGQKTAASKQPTTNLKQYRLPKIKTRRQQEAKLRAAAEVRPNLEQKDSRGRITLHRASEREDTHRVQLLLDAGSQVNAVDDGYTPLWLAGEQGHQDACRVLLAAGARLDVKAQPTGWTALHEAAYWGRPAVCEQLLAAGARPDVKSSGGTALHVAAYWGHPAVCELLLAAGARPDVKSSGGTALHVAAYWGHRAVCELLLAAGARPNEPHDVYQWTALHWAAGCGHAPVVQLLLQHGAERGARDNRGQTALDLARHYRRTEVEAMLQG